MKLLFAKIRSNIDEHIFKITLASCAVSIVFGYAYTFFTYDPIKVALVVFFCISSIVVIWQSISLFVGIIKANDSKRPSACEDFPEFRRQAAEMNVKLNKKHPFVKETGLDDIGWNFRENQLILGEGLLLRLTTQELNAVVIHEFTHARKRFGLYNWHYMRMFFIDMLSILLVANRITRPQDDFIACVVIISTFLIVFIIVSQWNEYEADSVASDKTSKQVYISALQKLKPSDRWNVEQLMHPSVNQRIAKLSKVKK